jgi:hypothetical protein
MDHVEHIIWVITHNPRDYPGKYVVRPHIVTRGWSAPGQHAEVFATLEEARAYVPRGCHFFPRDPSDDAVVVESWMQ